MKERYSEVIIFRCTPKQKASFQRSYERLRFNQSGHLRNVVDRTEAVADIFAGA